MKISLTLVFILITIVSFAQNTGTFTDTLNGKIYKTVVIGSQTWLAENLNDSTFRNGDPIMKVNSIRNLRENDAKGRPAWTYYSFDSTDNKNFGKLYNWYALTDPRGIGPNGWRIPSEKDWDSLIQYLGENAAIKLKNNYGWKFWDKITPCDSCKNPSNWDNFGKKGCTCGRTRVDMLGGHNSTCFWGVDYYDSLGSLSLCGFGFSGGSNSNDLRLDSEGDPDIFVIETYPYDYCYIRLIKNLGTENNKVNRTLGIKYAPIIEQKIKIGDQIWMNKNLNVSKFRNGDIIQEAKTENEWVKANENQQPAWCYYNNDSKNSSHIGKLYNWYAINDQRGLAPFGWHIPKMDEIWEFQNIFQDHFEDSNIYKLFSKETWLDKKNKSIDFGFEALPSGMRRANGKFSFFKNRAFWWSSDLEFWDYSYWGIYGVCYYSLSLIEGEYNGSSLSSPGNGYSVRCIEGEKQNIVVNSIENSNRVTDSDGNEYSLVSLGSTNWSKQNLNASRFRNGDIIVQVMNQEELIKAGENKQPVWCYKNFSAESGKRLGKMYNWFALTDPRGILPEGCRIPSDQDWDELNEEIYLIYTLSENKHSNMQMEAAKMTPIIEKKWITEVEEAYYEEDWVECSNCSYWTDKQKENNPCTVCKNKRGKWVKGKFIPKTQVRREVEQNLGWNGTNVSGFSALNGGSEWWTSDIQNTQISSNPMLYGRSIVYDSDDFKRYHHKKSDVLFIRFIK
jgi:uncharacterized protein (TIGR02145 family)